MRRITQPISRVLYAMGRTLFGGLHLKKRFPVVARLQEFLAGRARASVVEVNGYTLQVDVREGIDATKFEERTTDVMRKLVRTGDTVLDIGADIGYYACLAAKLAGPSGRVFAFEPNPRSFGFLEKNIATNGFANVTLVPKALSDKRGSLPFYENGPHSSLGYDRFAEGAPSRMVEVLPLDEFFSTQTPRIAVVKIDVEGSEGRVLRGMRNVLAKNPNVKVIMEFYPMLLAQAGEDPQEFLAAWAALGFVFYDIEVDIDRPVTTDELLERYPRENERMTNLLLKKG